MTLFVCLFVCLISSSSFVCLFDFQDLDVLLTKLTRLRDELDQAFWVCYCLLAFVFACLFDLLVCLLACLFACFVRSCVTGLLFDLSCSQLCS